MKPFEFLAARNWSLFVQNYNLVFFPSFKIHKKHFKAIKTSKKLLLQKIELSKSGGYFGNPIF
jgi:hypothetical protein